MTSAHYDPQTRSAFIFGALTGSRGLGLYEGEVLELPRKWKLTPKRADALMLGAAILAVVGTVVAKLAGAL
jgi:hypothetical protein